MNELVYLLKVDENEKLFEQLQLHLMVEEIPHYVRLATLAPISNYGYAADNEGTLLAWLDKGVIYGDPEDRGVPRTFVPWQNIAYLSEGDSLKEQMMLEAAAD